MWEWRRCERVWFSVSLAGVVNQLLQKKLYTHCYIIYMYIIHTQFSAAETNTRKGDESGAPETTRNRNTGRPL